MHAASNRLMAARMTPRGRGAVAVIRVAGDHTVMDQLAAPLFRPANGRPMSEQAGGRILFGQWGREAVEEVVVCRIDAETLEIHCHGGDQAADRILNDWQELGADIVAWPQLVTATTDVLVAELRDCLSRAITWRTAEHLLHQSTGLLRSAFERLQSMSDRRVAVRMIDELLRWSQFGVHLTEPWRVVLTGKPNVGKSSLINALLGYQRSIVFDQPGTTRDVVTAETAFDGWPVQLFDTAGIRAGAEELEAEGITRARQQLAEADLVVQLIDLSEPPEETSASEKKILVAHKADLADRWGAALPAEAIRVSSLTHTGVPELQREIMRRLVPVTPALDTPVPVTHRQVALLHRLRDALSGGAESESSSLFSEIFHGK